MSASSAVAKDVVGGSRQISTVAAPVLQMTEIEGKGRALVATQPLRAGQTVLRDSPILLYSALPFTSTTTTTTQQQQQQQQEQCYCSNCCRVLLLPQSTSTTTVVSCPRCSYNFCSPKCLSIALASSHSPWVCQALSRLRQSPLLLHHHQDLQLQARFLVAAYNLAAVSPSDFQTLLSLQGGANDADSSVFLHSLIHSLSPPPPHTSLGLEFSSQLTTALLAKDKLNAFGLMEPFAQDRERSVRAYGIYPRASFFNHDCLPNACRFDYLDDDDPHATTTTTTDLIIRMIHDVPQGREICLSYFPVNLKYSDRQRRLREDYGFTCECDRCKVEANWSEEEDEEDEAMDEEEEEDCDNQEEDMGEMMDSESESGGGVAVVKEEDNDFPHAYFFLRYMCNRKNCWGTLAPPLPPKDATPSSTVVECNVCGNYQEVMSPEE